MAPLPSRSADDPWTLVYEGYDPAHEPLREALCTLANGYLGTRGAAAECRAGGPHYPGTYVAGVFDRLTTCVAGRDVENEDLVNAPNWLPLQVCIDGGEWLQVDDVELLDHRQELWLREGVLVRRTRFRDHRGRRTSVEERRVVSMAEPHLALQETTVRAEDWSGELTVRSTVDGGVENRGVARYRDLASRHLETLEATEAGDGVALLRVRTVQSQVEIATAIRTRVYGPAAGNGDRALHAVTDGSVVGHEKRLPVRAGEEVRVEKVVGVHTSRDPAISTPAEAALEEVRRAPGADDVVAAHRVVWESLWERFAVDLGTDGEVATILHLHLFHLLQTVSPHIVDLDVGVPARGLHGEAYRGHIFWDEVFVFPLVSYRMPDVARSLLRYRHRRLPAARRAARDAGCHGAMFPWQSGSSGREESQLLHLNPHSGNWVPDNSSRQRHINVAIAYNVWHYVRVTDDVEFLVSGGAELYCEAARFLADLATYDAAADRWDVNGVMGPDEFHDQDPSWDGPGLRNNAYTNVMTAWVLAHSTVVLAKLPAADRDRLRRRLDLTDEELARWDAVSRRLRVPFHADGVISQFQGYEALAELDWDGYRERHGDIHRLDRLLEAEGASVNDYRASKQADVLMLLYLLPTEELLDLFARLGYPVDDDVLERTVRFYLARTSHGSTLSKLVHSWVLARRDQQASWALFREVLESDVTDAQGGTTPEGIHLGAMAGTVDLLQRCYAGMAVRDDVLHFDPVLPPELAAGLGFRVFFRSRWLEVSVTADTLTVSSEPTAREPVLVHCGPHRHPLGGGGTVRFDLPPAGSAVAP